MNVWRGRCWLFYGTKLSLQMGSTWRCTGGLNSPRRDLLCYKFFIACYPVPWPLRRTFAGASLKNSAETDEIINFNMRQWTRATGMDCRRIKKRQREINETQMASSIRLCRFDFSDFLRHFSFIPRVFLLPFSFCLLVMPFAKRVCVFLGVDKKRHSKSITSFSH